MFSVVRSRIFSKATTAKQWDALADVNGYPSMTAPSFCFLQFIAESLDSVRYDYPDSDHDIDFIFVLFCTIFIQVVYISPH